MVAPRQKLSPAEYLVWERAQPTKHEYYRGEVFAMAGASLRHNALCSEVIGQLRERLRVEGCRVLTSDQRVALDRGERYVYPDATVVCGTPVVEHGDVLLNPTIVVEILSLSTEQTDRGSKWQSYQRLTSLHDYILVPQLIPRIELFSRDDAGGWSYRAAAAGERVVLSSGGELHVDELFAGMMELPGDAPPPLITDHA